MEVFYLVLKNLLAVYGAGKLKIYEVVLSTRRKGFNLLDLN